jgi:hypothetical protein
MCSNLLRRSPFIKPLLSEDQDTYKKYIVWGQCNCACHESGRAYKEKVRAKKRKPTTVMIIG